jgi:hypothetical protein
VVFEIITEADVDNDVAFETPNGQDVIAPTDRVADNPTADPSGILFTPSDKSGLDDNSVDIFTPADSDSVTKFDLAETQQFSNTLALESIGQVQIIGDDGTGHVGNIASKNFEEINLGITCFTQGTLIATKSGLVEVQDITKETQVFTLDNGYQRVRWMGSRKLNAAQLIHNPKLKPVRIKAGALGQDKPNTDLVVSQQHGIMIRCCISERMFGSPEILVAAIKLVGMEGIDVLTGVTEVEYFHVLFDNHEILLSNGALTESLFVGPETLKSALPEAREELLVLFPEFGRPNFAPIRARPVAKTVNYSRT